METLDLPVFSLRGPTEGYAGVDDGLLSGTVLHSQIAKPLPPRASGLLLVAELGLGEYECQCSQSFVDKSVREDRCRATDVTPRCQRLNPNFGDRMRRKMG